MTIQKTGWNFAQMAANQGKKLMSIPLKDKATANVLWNNNAVDCFIIKNGKLEGARGAAGSTEHVADELIKIIDKLQEIVEPGADIFKNFLKATFK